jgi:hypothetical protein
MAASVQDTILMSDTLDGDLPDKGYKVLHDGLEEKYEPIMVTERALTGKMHIHRLTDAGSPMLIDGYRYTLILTLAEKIQLASDVGKTVYFMQHYRDDADPGTYRKVMLFRSITEVENFDPMLEYWRATIELEEATGQTV